jgi:cob(I)alamin adenosyltransferase
MKKLNKGFIQIYTGNGKGKTTAAIGQAVRASGAGLKTYFVQFMKDYPYSELEGLAALKKYITVVQIGKDDFVLKKTPPNKTEIKIAENGLITAKEKMLSGKFDIIILDEVCVSIYFGLFKTIDILNFLKLKPENVELILTGRYCPQELIDAADLVTEMKEVKHYYKNDVPERKGIES